MSNLLISLVIKSSFDSSTKNYNNSDGNAVVMKY